MKPSAEQFRHPGAGMAVGILSLVVAGCATGPRLFVDRLDEPVTCRQVAWLEAADRPASITEQRVRGETMTMLATKGYIVDAAEPDCLVSGVVYAGDRPSPTARVGIGAGRFGGRFGGSVGVHAPVGGATRTVGNLAIDVIDVALHAEVWRGTLEAAFRTPEPSAGEIRGAVQQIIAAFPDRG